MSSWLSHTPASVRWTFIVLGCSWLWASQTYGQEVPLYLEQRYDEIVLTSEFDDARIQVFPLPFGPSNMPKDADLPLRVRLIDYPDLEFDIAWKDIAKIDFFEDAVIAEANRLLKAGKLEAAYDALRFVWKSTPRWRGLQEAVNDFLLADAVDAYRENLYDEAMVLLEELFRRKPDPKYSTALGHVVDRAFAKGLAQKDYVTARQLLTWVSNRPQLKQQERVAAWRKSLRELADQQLEAARVASSDGRYRDALSAIDRAMQILPEDASARQLANTILAKYPRVTVAVSQFAPAPTDFGRSWAEERMARLIDRHLVELTSYGADGGQYKSGYGQIDLDTDRLGLTLQCGRGTVREAIAETLLRVSRPSHSESDQYLSQLLQTVDPHGDDIHLRVQKNTLRWLPLLDIPIRPFLPHWQPFQIQPAAPPHQRQSYLANPQYVLRRDHGLTEVMERRYTRQNDMIAAIESAEVDVVERLLPTEAAAIQNPEIVVHRYGLISMYFLVPNNQSKLSSNRVFRRGVVYALPRENMLNQLILLGRSFPGCDVLSGPFHSGFDRNDPMAYAYDGQIKPRTFDPALGATLIAMGWHLTELDAMDQQELAAESDHPLVDETQNDDHKTGVVDTSDSDTKRIVIVHADDAILASLADLICRSLRTAGVHCESRRLASGESRPPANESWHLWLTDFTAREPIIDIFHMFGPTGLVTKPSAYVQQALNELAEVKRWSDARAVLNRLHELVHNELSVIPLWQLTNHYAYRRGLQGLSDNAMTLYQDIDLWSVERTDVQ